MKKGKDEAMKRMKEQIERVKKEEESRLRWVWFCTCVCITLKTDVIQTTWSSGLYHLVIDHFAVRESHIAILISRMHLATIVLLCKQTTDNSQRALNPNRDGAIYRATGYYLFLIETMLDHVTVVFSYATAVVLNLKTQSVNIYSGFKG